MLRRWSTSPAAVPDASTHSADPAGYRRILSGPEIGATASCSSLELQESRPDLHVGFDRRGMRCQKLDSMLFIGRYHCPMLQSQGETTANSRVGLRRPAVNAKSRLIVAAVGCLCASNGGIRNLPLP